MEEYIIPQEALEELSKLTDREEQLNKDCDKWFDKYMSEACKKATTIEEINRLFGQAALGNCDKEGQFRDFPGLIDIHRAFAIDVIRGREIAKERGIIIE